MFRHHSFCNSSRQGVEFCFSRTKAHCLLCSLPNCECCVSPLHNSATCAFARCCVACLIAVCVHVHELRRCNDFAQALCIWNAVQVSHNTLQIHLVTLGCTCNFSCCLFHAAHDVCSFLARVQPQLFCALLVFRLPGRWRPLHTRSRHRFCFFQTKNSYHVSDSLPPSILGPFARSLYPGRELCHPASPFVLMILIKTCFHRSSTKFKSSLPGPNSEPSST